MKKLLLALVVCLTTAVSVNAQEKPHVRSRQAMAPMNVNMNIDMVVDTAVMNKLGIEPELMGKILALQEQKKAEHQKMMRDVRVDRSQLNGQDQRTAMQEKRNEYTNQYRKELRALMGDELYISYLEKQLDSRNHNRGGMNRGPRAELHQGNPARAPRRGMMEDE